CIRLNSYDIYNIQVLSESIEQRAAERAALSCLTISVGNSYIQLLGVVLFPALLITTRQSWPKSPSRT
ncbi:MAG: hypothetical protein KAY37_02150, partial [Phycisphaerae bacterium]|nr:hypothetical protein [Phycisphaerae bacterium]